MTTDRAGSLATRLATTLARLCLAIGAYLVTQARGPYRVQLGTTLYESAIAPSKHPTLPTETWTLLTSRLNRLAHRFRTLFARWQTGTLLTPRPSRAGSPCNRKPQPRLPTTSGWIGARIQQAAPCAGSIEHLLHNEPQMRDFVRAAPQAARLLRPLARMLGLTLPDYLRPKAVLLPSPRPPRGGWAAKRTDEGGSSPTDPPKPEPPGTPNRPLQPEIRAAARAWKKYDR